jgi:hypothetical protein
MSHFAIAVIGDVDTLLAPYDENIRVAPRTDLTAEQVLEEFKANNKGKFKDVREFAAWYYGRELEPDSRLTTTYNPDSKWDWYEIGGRWWGLFGGQNSCTVEEFLQHLDEWKTWALVLPTGTWYEKGEMGWFGLWNYRDAPKPEEFIGEDNLRDANAWRKAWDTFEEERDIAWHKEIVELLKYVGRGTVVTIVDCHI